MTTKTTYLSIGYRSHSKSILDSFAVHIIIVVFLLFFMTNNFYRAGGIPWPLLIFLPLTLALARREVLNWVMFACFRRPTIDIIAINLIFIFINALFNEGSRATVAFYTIFSLMLLLGCVLYVFQHPHRLLILNWLVIIILSSSVVVYVLQEFDVPFAYTVRDAYFSPTVKHAMGGIRSILTEPSGLILSVVLVGYQLSGLIPTLVVIVFTTRHIGLRIIMTALLVVALVALLLSTQRATALGVTVASIFILNFLRRARFVIIVQLIFIGVLSLTVLTPVLGVLDGLVRQVRGDHLIQNKFRNSEEIGPRLNLQIQALQLLTEHPFGLMVGDTTWHEEVDFSETGRSMGVHNGYLKIALQLGIFPTLGMVYILLFMMQRFTRELQNMPLTHYSYFRIRLGLIAGLIATLISALFHHSSLFDLEPTTWTIYAILVVWSALESKYPNLYSELIPADASPRQRRV